MQKRDIDLPLDIEKELYTMTERLLKTTPKESIFSDGIFYFLTLICFGVFDYAAFYAIHITRWPNSNLAGTAVVAAIFYALVNCVLVAVKFMQGSIKSRKFTKDVEAELARRKERINILEKEATKQADLIIDRNKKYAKYV